MDVQVTDDKVPARDSRIGSDNSLHVRQVVVLRASSRVTHGQDLPSDHVATEDEGTGAMWHVLELDALGFAGCHRPARMFSFQRLHAGQLIVGDHAFSLFDQDRRLPIQSTDLLDPDLKIWISRGGQPVSPAVRLQIPLLRSLAACRPEILLTIPLSSISWAISRPVHWLFERPDRSGASQANWAIWHTCSSVIRLGAPGRGASRRRSATGRSAKLAGCRISQRSRHKRTISMLTSSWRAIWALFFPSAAARTMRARKAICCAVLWRRTNSSSACRSASVSSTDGGLGPRIGYSFSVPRGESPC